ncbi:Uncharacterised protein [Segatella copri]|nr:Uncharacterised protein [Segatella copri]
MVLTTAAASSVAVALLYSAPVATILIGVLSAVVVITFTQA